MPRTLSDWLEGMARSENEPSDPRWPIAYRSQRPEDDDLTFGEEFLPPSEDPTVDAVRQWLREADAMTEEDWARAQRTLSVPWGQPWLPREPLPGFRVR